MPDCAINASSPTVLRVPSLSASVGASDHQLPRSPSSATLTANGTGSAPLSLRFRSNNGCGHSREQAGRRCGDTFAALSVTATHLYLRKARLGKRNSNSPSTAAPPYGSASSPIRRGHLQQECGESPPAPHPATSQFVCSARSSSSGSTKTVCPLELAPVYHTLHPALWFGLTGITNRSPRMVISSSCTDAILASRPQVAGSDS